MKPTPTPKKESLSIDFDKRVNEKTEKEVLGFCVSVRNNSPKKEYSRDEKYSIETVRDEENMLIKIEDEKLRKEIKEKLEKEFPKRIRIEIVKVEEVETTLFYEKSFRKRKVNSSWNKRVSKKRKFK